MEPNENAQIANVGGSNSKKGTKAAQQPSERTAEASESPVTEEVTTVSQESSHPNPITTNDSCPEQRKSMSLQQTMYFERNNSTIQPSARGGAPSSGYSNITSVRGTSPKNVSVLPNAFVPLREILEGGMNLGDYHLTSHSTLSKKKKNRTKIPEEDTFFNSPLNPSTPADGGTLGDTNQYTLPKPNPSILRENPELDNPQNSASVNSFGGSIHHTEKQPPEITTINNTPSNNALGNFVGGRLSYLKKQNASSKGALKGSNLALNVSQRPKQNGTTRIAIVSEPSNVSNRSMESRNILFEEADGGCSRSTKEIRSFSLSDLCNLTKDIQDWRIPKVVNDISEISNNLNNSINAEQTKKYDMSKNSDGLVQVNLDGVGISQSGTLREDSQVTERVQRTNNVQNHEALPVPKRNARKDKSEKGGESKNLSIRDGEGSQINEPKVANIQMNNQLNQSLRLNNQRSLVTNFKTDSMSSENKDTNKLILGGSSVPKAASQRDNAVKKNPKIEMAQNSFTPPSSGLEKREPSGDVLEEHRYKRNPPASMKFEGETNLGNNDAIILAPNVTRKAPMAKSLSNTKETTSVTEEPLNLTESSSIMDLPVPDNMK